MCRTNGRRCERRWDDVHRLRYNAARRRANNTRKRNAAAAAGNHGAAAQYQGLVLAAEQQWQGHDSAIRAHEADAADADGAAAGVLDAGAASSASLDDVNGAPGPCSTCQQWSGPAHTCPQDRAEALEPEAARWRQSWSSQEAQALDDYSSVLHYDLNEALRSGAALDAEQSGIVAGLDQALKRAPHTEQPYTVYRGMETSWDSGDGQRGQDASAWVAANARHEGTVIFNGYTSTSLRSDQGLRFAGERSMWATSGVVFEIETTQGGYTGPSPEQEVLLARDTVFEVLDVPTPMVVEGKTIQRVRLRERTAVRGG